MSITYLSPASDRPVGGIKVLYRHSELLQRQGIASDVCHPQDPGFACGWFSHGASVRADHSFDPRTDLVVIPEIWAAPFAAACLAQGVRYAIFVQNAYLMHRATVAGSVAEVALAYRSASLVLAISDDSARLLRLACPDLAADRLLRVLPAVGELFRADPKRRLITYMPRKLPQHAAALCFLLQPRLPPGWALQAIDGLGEADVAAVLGESAIFLSFCELEGFGLPPLEAAFAGNLVVGYSGCGSREFFRRPVFREVPHGDLPVFVEAVCAAVREVEGGLLASEVAREQIAQVREAYSPQRVAASVRAFGERALALL